MDAIKRYQLIRPILSGEQTVKEVHQQTQVPLSTLYDYLKRFREGNGQLESLSDKSRAPHSNPNWFTEEQKDTVVFYKLQNPDISARQIAQDLVDQEALQISYHSVSNILKQRRLPENFFAPTNQGNSKTFRTRKRSDIY